MSNKNDCNKCNDTSTSPVQDGCVKTTQVKVLSQDDIKACSFSFKPSCYHTKLKDGDVKVGIGEPCETGEPCPTCPVLDGEPINVPCTIEGHLKIKDYGCDWIPTVCIPSIPPATGCAPIFGGEGGYDGGVPRWTNNCVDGCDLAILKACDPNFKTYIQGNWEHVLDLATHPEHTTQLTVNYDGNIRPINTQEWHALAYKLVRTSIRAGALREFINESNTGLAYVKTGTDTYALSQTINGEAIGKGIDLVSIKDSDGNITELRLPLPA